MTKRNWVTRIARMMLWLAPGAMLMGTSCGAELRASAIGATAEFVGATLGDILEAYVPVGTLMPNNGG